MHIDRTVRFYSMSIEFWIGVSTAEVYDVLLLVRTGMTHLSDTIFTVDVIQKIKDFISDCQNLKKWRIRKISLKLTIDRFELMCTTAITTTNNSGNNDNTDKNTNKDNDINDGKFDQIKNRQQIQIHYQRQR